MDTYGVHNDRVAMLTWRRFSVGAPSEHPTIEFAVRMRGDSLPPLEDCMVALPWLAGPQDRNELDDSVVMASRFELASPAMFRNSWSHRCAYIVRCADRTGRSVSP